MQLRLGGRDFVCIKRACHSTNLRAPLRNARSKIKYSLIHKPWFGHISEVYSKAWNGFIGINSIYGHYLPATFPPIDDIAIPRKFELSGQIGLLLLNKLIIVEISIHEDFGLHACHPWEQLTHWIAKQAKNVQEFYLHPLLRTRARSLVDPCAQVEAACNRG